MGFFSEGQDCDRLKNVLNVLCMEPLEWLVTFGTHWGMCWSNRVIGAAMQTGGFFCCVERIDPGALSKVICMLWWNRETKEERFYLIKNSKALDQGQKSCQYLYLATSVKGSLGKNIGSAWADEPSLSHQKKQKRTQEDVACHLVWKQQGEERMVLILSSLRCPSGSLLSLLVRDFMKPGFLCRNAAYESDMYSNSHPSAHTRYRQTWFRVTAPKP